MTGSNQHSEHGVVIANVLHKVLYVEDMDEAEIVAAKDALANLEEQLEALHTALDVLLDHAERIQEHVPKSEAWYIVRDNARVALAAASSPASEPKESA